ncbi:leucine-rich repeat-containing protein 40-like isoform X2 [Leptopilina heterotoma]|uniref:leucine-rich repeat-containing protein 40-like isoform X2 n=1 Tax=Leptopilina heterotoma TaxID=63436 RepID=UPI001CA821B2|nr:leucine-rich repeat-containing protein 40-like isoform X2 [Leptopilina heterotoma]
MKSARKRIANHKALFKQRTQKDDNDELSFELIISTRKSGQLDMSGRGLAAVPEKLWTINELTKEELDKLRKEIDFEQSKDCWWEQEPFRILDLSSNSLCSIDPRIKNLLDLTLLDLHDNLLETLPPEIENLQNLKNLNISFNKIKTIPLEFYKLIELRKLDLKNNILTELDEAIGDLIMLETLNLSSNNLTDIPGGTGYLVRLVSLDLSHNLLRELPPDITSMRGLKKLDASFNHLDTLPPLGELRKIETLLFGSNNLKTFPDTIGCSSLRELHLTNNNIAEIEISCLEGMGQLKTLLLGGNKIEVIPEEMIRLINLEHLDLSHNNISSIPNCIGIMPNLHNFIVEGNKLQNVRRDIVQLGTPRILRHLRQSSNASNIEIRDCSSPLCEDENLPDKYAMKNARLLSLIGKNLSNIPDRVFNDAKEAEVTCVDLSRNRLHELSDALSQVTTVTDLKLACNQLIEIPNWIGVLQYLQFLDLNRNRLVYLPENIANLERLRELNISFNKFTEIPECLYEISHLEILTANDNQIKNIDVPGLSKLRRLTILELSNNNIAHIPPELGNLIHLRHTKKQYIYERLYVALCMTHSIKFRNQPALLMTLFSSTFPIFILHSHHYYNEIFNNKMKDSIAYRKLL